MSSEHGQALPAGYELDGYHIEAVLGAGGFGITYRARETAIKRTVAIKEFLPAGVAMRDTDAASVRPISTGEEEFYEYGLERFRGEAETLVRFDHPNIVRVHRYFQANGTGYLVMQYVDGENLDAILTRAGTLTESEIREVVDPILNGLQQVHKAGFLHRDIKPANIYIRADGSPVLLDFGAARLALGEKSKSLTAIISGGFAPFEQYSSKAKQGPWTDIYALGATLYRAVTGRAPPDAMDRMEDDELVPARDAAGSGYSAALLAAIDTALAMKAADRPQSIDALRALLEPVRPADAPPAEDRVAPPAESSATIMPHAQRDAAVPPPESPQRKSGSASRWIIAALLAVIVAGGGYIGWDAYQAAQQLKAEAAAARQAAAAAKRAAEVAAEARREAEEARRKAAVEAKRKAAEAKRRLTTPPETLWVTKLGEKGRAFLPSTVIKMPNGDLAVAGIIQVDEKTETMRPFIQRIDKDGKVVWRRTLAKITADNRPVRIVAAADGSLTGVASGKVDRKTDHDVIAFRLDKDGRLVWQRRYGSGSDDSANSIVALSGGGFIIAGRSKPDNGSSIKGWILRLDADANLLWDRAYGGKIFDTATDIAVLPDGGFMVTGGTFLGDAKKFDLWLIRLDSTGKRLWDRTYGGPDYDSGSRIFRRPDGSFIVLGTTKSKGDDTIWILHLDAQGKRIRDQAFGGKLGKPTFTWAERLANRDILISGAVTTKSKKVEAVLMRLDWEGLLRWRWKFAGPKKNLVNSVIPMPDDEFVVVGATGDKKFSSIQSWIRRLGYK